jgi:hypothetical protein
VRARRQGEEADAHILVGLEGEPADFNFQKGAVFPVEEGDELTEFPALLLEKLKGPKQSCAGAKGERHDRGDVGSGLRRNRGAVLEFDEEPEEVQEQKERRSADLDAAVTVEEEVVGTLCLALESGVSRRPHWRLNRRSQGVDVPRQTAAVWGALKEARRGWGGVRGNHDGEGLGVRGGCLKRLHSIRLRLVQAAAAA